jgi:hypothetical protein
MRSPIRQRLRACRSYPVLRCALRLECTHVAIASESNETGNAALLLLLWPSCDDIVVPEKTCDVVFRWLFWWVHSSVAQRRAVEVLRLRR